MSANRTNATRSAVPDVGVLSGRHVTLEPLQPSEGLQALVDDGDYT